MNEYMNWIQGFFFGLISGLSEFMPLSSRAHQRLFGELFDVPADDPVMLLFVHAALIASLYFGFRPVIDQLKRNQSTLRQTGVRRRQNRTQADIRVVKNAAVPMIIGMFILAFVVGNKISLPFVSLFLIINGVIIYLPERLIRANKDASAMSYFDSLLIGTFSSLCVIPGFSGIGIASSVAMLRGGDRQKALQWSLFLLFPVLATSVCTDLISIFTYSGGVPFFSALLGYIFAFIGAFISGYLTIKLIRIITLRSSYAVFAYYSWGMALFLFLLYLTVV